ncbi:MAG TPA: hypothetical protein VKB38_05755 [Terracidiphilus sp.]|nr:hypothetical protein [Terracidiphilus sp.]
MIHNNFTPARRHRTSHRFGALCLIVCIAGPAAVIAQQCEHSPAAHLDSSLPPNELKPESCSYTPMTRRERWQDYERVNFESSGAFFQAFFTGLGDSLGNVPRWDSGMAGLSEHVGSEFATFTIGGTIHSSLAATLHQDTRYFPCSCEGAFHRTLHAASRTLFTYGGNGHLYPDVSGLAGIYGGTMLTTLWYPQKYTATGYGVRQANIAVGVTSAVYVIREFGPDIKRALHRRKAGDIPSSVAGPSRD